MRRLAAILLACVVTAGVTGPAAAQETESGPPWWQGDRAELAEQGLALTVPEGWVAFDLTGGLPSQVRSIATALEMSDRAAEDYLRTLRRVRDRGALLVLTTDDANCEVRVDPAIGPGHAEALAGYRYQLATEDEDILAVDPVQAVDLPSGPASRMSWTTGGGNPELSMYLGQRDDLVLEIKCSGQVRPADDWLSVAESFEWLTASGPADATVAGTPSPAAVDASEVPPGPPFPDRIEGTGVYDQAGVFGPFAVGATEQVIREVEEASGAQVVVYTQVKPESDTFEEASADAVALIDQWGLVPDGLVILFDLDESRCHGQVQLYATPGYAARHLSNAERQVLFDELVVPPLQTCDFDTALLGTMSRISAAAEEIPGSAASGTGDVASAAPSQEIEDLFPRALGDGALVGDEVTVYRTEEEVLDFFVGSQPDAAEIEAVQQIAERAGGSIDDMTIVDGWFALADGTTVVNLGAFQVRGADSDALRDSFHALAMAWMDDPAYAEEEIAGKSVLVYDTMETLQRINYVYVHDDVAWVFATFEEYAADVLDSLPG